MTSVSRLTGVLLRYGLGVLAIAAALGGSLLAHRLGVEQVEFPLLLMAVAIVVWYASGAPRVGCA